MNILPESEDTIRSAVDLLKAGGIVAHATETCYGFACDMTNAQAVEKLFALKQRPHALPVSALFPSIASAKMYVEWNKQAEEFARTHLPGALTLVLSLKNAAPPIFPTPLDENGQTSVSLGVRISSHPLAQKLAEQCSHPISTTSANIHGQSSPYSVDEIRKQYDSKELKPDLIIDSGVLPRIPSSTVIDLTGIDLLIRRKGQIETASTNPSESLE